MKVLHIDDDGRILKDIKEELSRYGVRAESTRSLKDAAAYIQASNDYDAVLTDNDLGPFGGDRAGMEIIRLCGNNWLPVVMFSGLPPRDVPQHVPVVRKSAAAGSILVEALKEAIERQPQNWKLVSTIRVVYRKPHARIEVWNRGARAGSFVVRAEDALLVAKRLAGPETEVEEIFDGEDGEAEMPQMRDSEEEKASDSRT